ncbi:ATP-dependent protease La type I [Lachnospiraceae bacterium KM106-2]|nr:ATP-dependent protease La type I [Lachnospiraceae bacterium KM106-2]
MLIIPVYNTLILPNVAYNLPFDLLTKEEVASLNEEDYVIILPLKEGISRKEITKKSFFDLGVIAQIESIKTSGEHQYISVTTEGRAKVLEFSITASRMEASIQKRDYEDSITLAEEEALLEEMKYHFTEVVKPYPWAAYAKPYIEQWRSINQAISLVSPYLQLTPEEKFELLAMDSIDEKNDHIIDMIRTYRETQTIQSDVKEQYESRQKEIYREMALKNQIELLQNELDELHPESVSDEKKFADKIEKSGMPKEVKDEVNRVLQKFKQEGKNGHEYGNLYEYLDFVVSLKWKCKKTSKINISKARETLNKDHYGLTKVKDRILEQLAVMALNKKQTGSILLLVGPPGTGKTSMGKSIAKALGREYVRISLGGVRDEAEIRGHRRTYVGAMPGRIMDGIKRSGSMNPVMVLDEIDKLASEYNGNPASALLEVLDPEQNNSFLDHYLNVPYDLSKVFFICTANTTDTIPGPLLDRMEVITLTGYTPLEKENIARKYLIPNALKEVGMKETDINLEDSIITKIVQDYTREAGVRGLKKQFTKLFRSAALKKMETGDKQITVETSQLNSILGRKVASHEKSLDTPMTGVVTGLAWTAVGGEILMIETSKTPGSGQIKITGQLGDVMKESVSIALSTVKSRFPEKVKNLKEEDLHIHVPAGAVPKDGPSAGITLFTALASLVNDTAVDSKLAMTGELSLRGAVLPIGGLPEKLMAAERAGIKKVLIPFENKEDLEDVPQEIKNKLTIIPVSDVTEVIKHALN